MKMKTLKKQRKIQVPLEDIQRLFAMGTSMADLAEEILEAHGEYTEEFLKSLRQSEADIKAGRIYSVNSLDELLDK